MMRVIHSEDSVQFRQAEGDRMARAFCPECGALITISDPKLGAMIACPGCNVKLEIFGTDPLDVYFPFDEVWDDDAWNADWDDEPQTE
jgi:alpha-aminoadipate carrier protein LysW